MNKVEAVKIIIDSLDESERKSLLEIFNGEIVKIVKGCNDKGCIHNFHGECFRKAGICNFRQPE